MDQSSGLHHFHKRKRIHVKHEKYPHPDKFKRSYDKTMLLVSVIAPLGNLPQLVKIWINQHASGVSILSWVIFAIFSFMWFIYGILHKDKPIIIMNAFLVLLQVFIAIGAFIYV